jgi:hypothetical protein
MPRQQLAQPGHLNEADLHNFSDLVPPVAFAVVGAFSVHGHRGAKASGARSVATEDAMPVAHGGVVCNCDNRERNASSKTSNPMQCNPSSVAKADGEPF